MHRKAWLTSNSSAIAERLRWLHGKPDGVLCVEPAGPQFVIVTKDGSKMRLLTVEQVRPRTTITQSHLDLSDPLYLVSPYTQAAMLGLLWQSEPRRIYVVGLGGGRVPLLLHHYLPQTVIDCAEIDPVVLNTAIKYFGVRADERLRIAVQDGREWLAHRDPNVQVDVIFVDAFLGNGYTPYRLATKEFYRLCQTHLSQNGVLIVNLLETVPFFDERVKTLQSVFPQTYLCPVPGGNCVLFATFTASNWSVNALRLTLSLALGPAIRATLGFVFEPALLVKLLLGSGKHKVRPAVFAGFWFIFECHLFVHPPSEIVFGLKNRGR